MLFISPYALRWSPHWLLLLLRLLLLYCSVLTCCEAFITMLRTDPNTPAFFRYVDCPRVSVPGIDTIQ
ncbi:hypothetical protein KUCAC02_008272 [Chaenocephalus aceratus]|uniref:Uncharacterized protein n=1 Tax=Chaenocephalus aceratus TaxID=36190 RepID=A0ACB9X7Z0_CHAAC|nr:hypothetical protein KUCAC02_008272 [Chaenocephalus aceratus]